MDDDIIEFVIAQDRKYSMDHLWFQQKDQKLMIGVSEFLRVEIGDVLRVILPQAETEIDEGGSLFSLWTADEKVSLTSPFSGVISTSTAKLRSTQTWLTIPPTTTVGSFSLSHTNCNSTPTTSSLSRTSWNTTSTSNTSPNFERACCTSSSSRRMMNSHPHGIPC